MVETSLGLGDGSEVFVLSGKDFWGLLDGQRSAIVGPWSVCGHIPVRVVSGGDCVVGWSWSLWQVGGGNDLETVMGVGDVFH